MGSFFTALFSFIKPIVVVFASITTLVAFLLGALLNPQGFLNSLICGAIDMIASVFPSTPDNLKVASLIDSIASSMPAVGRGIIREFFVTISAIVAIMSIIKIYKLLPFKAT